MLFNTVSLIAVFAAGSAVSSPVDITDAPTVVRAAAGAATWAVVVGDLNNAKAVTFTPNTVTAAAGDTIQYQFASANHTVTQSAGPQAPCKPAANAVNSGFVPVQSGASKVQTFNMVVQDDSAPMYMYCAQAQHCQQGMVMTINPAAGGDQAALVKAASKAKANVPAKKTAGGTKGQVATNKVAAVSGGGNGGGAAKAAGGKGAAANAQGAKAAGGAGGAKGAAAGGKAAKGN